ncbi:alpha/beta hydrolase [Pseudonocardia spinosispora]|uniref:alpha/beta hydrolase n=1 Tax=Pseudonocardia spinosispora TaxID=103441 RepID=UPI0003F89C87|nr:alpha/beta hydrolase [Pseudonocardia spinosispora]
MRSATVPILVGALGASGVAGAYRPLVSRWPFSIGSALTSSFASESPLLLAGVHTVAAAAAWRAGGPAGVAGTVLNIGGLAGLAGLAGDARRSAVVLAEALRDAGVEEPDAVRTRRPAGVLHGSVARRRYRRVADVSYSEHGPFGTLDVWHRADLPQDGHAPVLLQIHGGAWQMGDKLGQAEPLLGYLAERGWVCVTVNYRLAPAQRWPAMIVDVKRAIAWIREHISGHGGDPGFVAVTGGSAGGHLAALAAVSANDPDYQPGFTEVDTSLAAAVPLYGVHDFTHDRQGLWPLLEGKVIGTTFDTDERTWRQASPALRVGSDTPPFLVVHGSTDAIVGVEQSRRFVTALRAGSPSPVGYAELPHAQHGFDTFATARTAHTVDAVYRFLTSVHQGRVTAGAGQTGRNTVRAAR